MIKVRNLITLFLLLVLISPSLIKLFHQHDHTTFIQANQKFEKKCAICDFEFSLFSKQQIIVSYTVNTITTDQTNPSSSGLFHKPIIFSFQLRAPPKPILFS